MTDNIGLTIAKYRKQVTRLSRCRLVGTLDGVKCRIVPRHTLPIVCQRIKPTRVIWDRITPTDEELEIVK